MKGGLEEIAFGALMRLVQDRFGGNVCEAARALGMSNQTLDAWVKGRRRPTMKTLFPVLERMGARIVFGDDRQESTGSTLTRAVGGDLEADALRGRVAELEDKLAAARADAAVAVANARAEAYRDALALQRPAAQAAPAAPAADEKRPPMMTPPSILCGDDGGEGECR